MGFDKTSGTTTMVSFEFAYDNPVFSDRILRMEVTSFGDQAYEVLKFFAYDFPAFFYSSQKLD
jgi:hypothetical protein